MSDFVKAVRKTNNYTTTENGAVALKSTLNACLDAFGSMGAMKNVNEETVIKIFSNAFLEDRETAMRMLFYMRDIRGGQGMRKAFRICLNWLATNYSEYVRCNLDNILYYGRGDDYLCLLDNENLRDDTVKYIEAVLKEDKANMAEGKAISMLGKWLPSENTSSVATRETARKLMGLLNMRPKDYRKMLSALRAYNNVVETKMSANAWSDIDYERVPAKASLNYSDAFCRHNEEGYTDYLNKLATGDAKVNAKSLFPVDIMHRVLNYKPILKNKIIWNAMWNALPDYFEGREETGICMVDTSASMYGDPIEVALSLGIYCADKCRGPFKNHFITFSEKPTLVEIKGNDIFDKSMSASDCDWGMNTNIEAAFDLILNAAIKNNLKQEDMPSKLYIISDMQFDQARSNCYGNGKRKKTFMQEMKQKFVDNGYVMPAIVYWNVRASMCGMFQETFEGENCAMVSGYSPSLFEAIVRGTEFIEETITDENGETKTVVRQNIDPMEVMKKTLFCERYDRVKMPNC